MSVSRFVCGLVLLLGLTGAVAVSAQEYSQKQEIAVFKLSYYSWSIPNGALGAIDQRIREVFVNLGRFDVIGYAKSLTTSDVSQFIETLRRYKEANTNLPREVQLGHEAFTEADFNKLVGGFIVVVPSVTGYNTRLDDAGSWNVDIDTSFTFINVQDLKTIGSFTVSTSGSDQNQIAAIQDAVDSIPSQLSFEIRKMDAFQIKTGIVDIQGPGTIVIEFGKNMGVKRGDEFAVLAPKVVAGHTFNDEAGLLVVKDVQDEFSIARPVYTNRKLYVGDQLREVPRFGVDTSAYFDAMVDGSVLYPLAGVRAVLSRGFFSLRPALEAEIPIHLALSGGVPANLLVGAEVFNLYLGRLQIAPTALVGIGGNYYQDQFYLSHIGGKAQLNVSALFGRDVKVYGEVGFGGMLALNAGLWGPWNRTYGGPFVGIGATYKF